jgi:hypothetical protein
MFVMSYSNIKGFQVLILETLVLGNGTSSYFMNLIIYTYNKLFLIIKKYDYMKKNVEIVYSRRYY